MDMIQGALEAPTLSAGAKAALASYVTRVALCAAAVDIFYFVFFLIHDSPVLAWINVASVSLYAAAFMMLQRRQMRAAVALFWLEVLTHAAIGTVWLGWASGFHYLLLVFIPLLALSNGRRQALVLTVFIVFFLLGLDLVQRRIGPVAPLPEAAMLLLKWFNLSVFVGLLSALALYYRGKIAAAETQLRTQANQDALTGLFNRHYFRLAWDREAARKRRNRSSACLVILDMDHFKRINDGYGHAAGDLVLMQTSRILRQALRDVDTVARWGGEEFVLLMPDTPPGPALLVTERIREALASSTVVYEGSEIRCTASFGLTELQDADTINQAVSRADQALYQSKQQGRNRVTQI